MSENVKQVPEAELTDFERGFDSGGVLAFGMSAVIALIYAGLSLLPLPWSPRWFWPVNAALCMAILGGRLAWSLWRAG